jgi:archaeosine synthase alpha-subunit
MLEVLGRSGVGRSARWTASNFKTLTPNVIFTGDWKGPIPKGYDLVFTDKGGVHSLHASEGLDNEDILVPHGFYRPLSQMRGGRADASAIEGTSVTVVRGEPKAIAEQVKASNSEIIVLGNAFEYRRDARQFAAAMVAIRGGAGHKRLVCAPGMMDISNMALLAYMGVDLMDTSLLQYRSSRMEVCLAEGAISARDSKWLGASTPDEAFKISAENAAKELQLVRHMIEEQRLRELVEMRIHASPWLVSALRIFDEGHYDFQEKYFPVIGPRFYCNAKQSLTRPDILRYRKRIMERYVRPADKKVLLLIPCSAKKPYFSSKSHQAFKRVLTSVSNFDVIHEVIITSPLGAVPRELELFYPAAQYDIPVTGHWDREEVAMVQEMVRHIVSFGYDHIICHLGDESEFVLPVLDEFVDTTKAASCTSKDALDNLYAVLQKYCAEYPRVSRGVDRASSMRSTAIFQFGEAGAALTEGCEVSGSYPYSRFMAGRTQLGMLTPDRGMISLTIDGAERVAASGRFLVNMKDFDMTGNLFAVGVESADPDIRIGDEAIVMRKGRVEAVGVAMMNGEEMADSAKGEAVRIRHKRKPA